MAEFKGIDYLKNKLGERQIRVLQRYGYYEMHRKSMDPSPIIPDNLKQAYNATLGWCTKAVDALADRLCFVEFRNDDLDMNSIFRANNPDMLFDNAILSALIGSCCFIYIRQDDGEYPRLQVIDGGNATGEIDQTTGLLTEGYAVLQRDKNEQPIVTAYFVPGRTDIYENGKMVNSISNPVDHPLLVPVIHRPDAMRPFGHSRITRACINLQDKARHTLTRADVAAEFYSFPQKYVLGLDDEAERMQKWEATISSFLDFRSSESGSEPKVGQFQQQSMDPHINQFRMYAAAFAGEAGLTLDDLGFVTDNPSSAEAIKASHENLRLAARKAQRNFSTGFMNAGYVAACLRDEYNFRRETIFEDGGAVPVWEPIFEPDAATLSGIGDGLSKLSQVAPGYLGPDNLRDMTGIKQSEDPFPTEQSNGV